MVNGETIIQFKIKDVTIKVDNFLKAYKLKFNKRYSGEIQKIYMIHQEQQVGHQVKNVYIGKTKQDILDRLAQHTKEVIDARSGKKDWTLKLHWLDTILKNGFPVHIRLLNNVPKDMIYIIEADWIKYLRERGFNLMNMENKKYWK